MLASAGIIEFDDPVSIMNSFSVRFIYTVVVKYLFLSVILFIFSIRYMLDSDWSDSCPIVVVPSSISFRILRLLFSFCLHNLAKCLFCHSCCITHIMPVICVMSSSLMRCRLYTDSCLLFCFSVSYQIFPFFLLVLLLFCFWVCD